MEKQTSGDFKVYCDKGQNKLADYHTKHNSPTHHKNVRQKYYLQNFLLTSFSVPYPWNDIYSIPVHTVPNTKSVRAVGPVEIP